MSCLLIITQKVDEGDDLLGFFASWIREFAKHYERVTVIALGAAKTELPDNVTVYSLGKESGTPRWRRWFGFVNLLRREVPHHDAVFAHMSPVFAIAAWPFTRAWHKRLVLWYLHRSRTLRLRCALTMVDALVTADARSLTIRSPKIHAVGHGIDVARFVVPDRIPPDGRPLRILSVGRISSIKGFETLIRAAAKLREADMDCEVRIVGKPVMPGDYQYERELHMLVTRLGVGDIVHFFGFVPHRDIPAHYRWADIVVGCTPPGGIDKVLLEAMAAGCVVFTSNTVMRAVLGAAADGLLFRHADAQALAAALAELDDYPAASFAMRQNVDSQTNARVVSSICRYLP
jgi:glycosyltransferase involved in cell wall biosynthesis